MAQATCKHPDGCTRKGRIKRGWCPMHYQRVIATGDPGPAESHKTDYGTHRDAECSVDGCMRPMRAALLCHMHYKRKQLTGDVGGVESLRREMPPDSKNWTPGQRHRYYTYGLTPEAFDAMLAAQGGRCYVCRTDKPNGFGWSVDHCHVTGAIRFIACNPCNAALGYIREDPAIAKRLYEVTLEIRQWRLPLAS